MVRTSSFAILHSVEPDAADVASGVANEPIDQESLLRETQAELDSYRAALNRHAIVGVTDRKGTIIDVNDPFCRISQYSRNELIGKAHSILNSGHHPREFFRDMWRTIGAGGVWHGEICNRAKDGSQYWVDTTIVPRRATDRRISGYVSIRYDITTRKQAEAALTEENHKRQQAELLLRDVIEALPNGIAAYDTDDRLALFNSAYKEFYGVIAPAIVQGATFESILRYGIEHGQFMLSSGSATAKLAWLDSRLHDHHNPGRQLIQQLSDGRWLQVQEKRSRSGYVVGVRTDITDLKRAERQIKHQAERDPLTGLYNRRVVLDRLTRSLAAGRRSERCGALVLVDLDRFKGINDSLGHGAGDTLLVEVGERLRSAVRKTDVVARLGGDEFAIILFDLVSERDVRRLLEKLLHRMAAELVLGTRSVVPSASFGVAFFPQHGDNPTALMKHADLALYDAKNRGRATYAIYNPDLARTLERRIDMTNALQAAMVRGDHIRVALQPQVSFTNGRHTGFEALVRWQRGRTPVPAAELISVAEEAGLIVNLGYQIVDKALAAMRAMLDRGSAPGRLAINVAAAQLREPGFARQLNWMIAHHRFRPEDVEIEITENVVLDGSADAIVGALKELHATGIGIALDDFGTGYASLSHLKRIPISKLKIDRSFTAGLNTNADDAAIARTIISLAHSLDLQVVAEGVETEGQYQFLSNHGCDYAQGYLISKPLLGADIYKYIQNQGQFFIV